MVIHLLVQFQVQKQVVQATTTYSFTIRATDNESQTTDRAFTITVSHGGSSGGGQFN